MAIIIVCNKILNTNSLIQKYSCAWFWRNKGEQKQLLWLGSWNLPHSLIDKHQLVTYIHIGNCNIAICYGGMLHGREILSTQGILMSTQREWLVRKTDIVQVKKRGKRKTSMCKSPVAERSKAYSRNRKKTRKVVWQGGSITGEENSIQILFYFLLLSLQPTELAKVIMRVLILSNLADWMNFREQIRGHGEEVKQRNQKGKCCCIPSERGQLGLGYGRGNEEKWMKKFQEIKRTVLDVSGQES